MNRRQFSTWMAWPRRSQLPSMKLPGIYALAMIPSAEQVYPALFDRLRASVGEAAEDFDWDHAERQLAGICSRLGIQFVSLASAFRERCSAPAPEDDFDWLFLNGRGHFSERGNEVAAEVVHRFLTRGDGDPSTPTLVEQILE